MKFEYLKRHFVLVTDPALIDCQCKLTRNGLRFHLRPTTAISKVNGWHFGDP
jgi:hypothetical protein